MCYISTRRINQIPLRYKNCKRNLSSTKPLKKTNLYSFKMKYFLLMERGFIMMIPVTQEQI